MNSIGYALICPINQSVLSHTKRFEIVKLVPFTLFFSFPADNSLRLIISPETAKLESLDGAKAIKLLNTK